MKSNNGSTEGFNDVVTGDQPTPHTICRIPGGLKENEKKMKSKMWGKAFLCMTSKAGKKPTDKFDIKQVILSKINVLRISIIFLPFML